MLKFIDRCQQVETNNLLLLRMVECCVEVLSYYNLTTSVTDTDVLSVQLYTTALKLPWIPKVDLSKGRGHNILRQNSSFFLRVLYSHEHYI